MSSSTARTASHGVTSGGGFVLALIPSSRTAARCGNYELPGELELPGDVAGLQCLSFSGAQLPLSAGLVDPPASKAGRAGTRTADGDVGAAEQAASAST